MPGFDGKDGSSSAENLAVGYQRGSAEVSGNTNALKDGSGGDHARGVSEAEVVLAGLNRLNTSLGNSTL